MHKVSEEKIAQLRLKFWYDALDKIYEKNSEKILPEHPVIQELNNVGVLRPPSQCFKAGKRTH